MTSSGSPGTRVWGQRPGQPGESTGRAAIFTGRRAWGRSRAVLGVVLGALLALALAGCSEPTDGQTPAAVIAPPAIRDVGILHAGVDLSYPPFAGIDDGRKAGIDVDTAAALAERLGLEIDLVDVGPSAAATALAEGRIDVCLGALPITDAVLADLSFAGSYIYDAPGVFVTRSIPGSPSADPYAAIATMRLAAQQGSVAYWKLGEELSEDSIAAYPTVRAAFEALAKGLVDGVVCDSIVGAYLARDFSGVRLGRQLEPAVPLGVAVAKDAAELEAAVRQALDELAAEGVLDAIRSKWVGDLPELTSTL